MLLLTYAHIWIVFSLIAALCQGARLAVTKHLGLSFSAPQLTLYVNLASSVVSFPLVFWYHQIPLHDPLYVGAVIAGGLLSGLGGWALTIAIQRSEISLVGPAMTFTPVFVVILEWMMTQAHPGALGLVGLALLMSGSYLLALEPATQQTWYQPLRQLVSNPGSRFTLIASLCFAAASVFGRIAIQLSDPLSFAVVLAVVNPLLLFGLFSVRDPKFYRQAFSIDFIHQFKPLLLLGGLFALMRIADQIALSLTLASYAMAVKRSSGLFAVLLGRWYYHEGHTICKLSGGGLLLVGLWLLTQTSV